MAWGHAFIGKNNHLIAEGVVAKEVLTSQGLWEVGTKYNKAVARSLAAVLPSGERARAAAAHGQNVFRWEVAMEWDKRGVPIEVVGRVVNRFFTEEPWKSGATLRYLALALITELGFVDQEKDELNLNQNALIALQVPLLDIYQGSRENFAKYNIKAD